MTDVVSYKYDKRDDSPARRGDIRELAELAGHYPSRSAAIQDAIHSAWRQLQADKLEAGYAAAVADNPHYPYESGEEAAVLRTRRRARQERGTLT